MSSTDINLIDRKPSPMEVKKRSVIGSSLIVGIVLIALFLALFVLEFSRILTLTGKVNRTAPATRLNESGVVRHHST
jgi:hypothetical protein